MTVNTHEITSRIVAYEASPSPFNKLQLEILLRAQLALADRERI